MVETEERFGFCTEYEGTARGGKEGEGSGKRREGKGKGPQEGRERE